MELRMKPIFNLESAKGGVLALYGGTLDPVHKGHLMVARQAMVLSGWDRLLWMVAGTPPHKRGMGVTDPVHRLAMTRLAVEPYDGFFVSDWEVNRDQFAYTADTLTYLIEEIGVCEVEFLMGADSLMQVGQWYDPKRIFRLATVVAVGRPCQVDADTLLRQVEALRETYGARIRLLAAEGPDISATELRLRLEKGEIPEDDLPASVADYIRDNGLYGVRHGHA